jgi:hypothetical protein
VFDLSSGFAVGQETSWRCLCIRERSNTSEAIQGGRHVIDRYPQAPRQPSFFTTWRCCQDAHVCLLRGLGRPSECIGKCLYYLIYNQLGIYVEATNKMNMEGRARNLLNSGKIIVLASLQRPRNLIQVTLGNSLTTLGI